MTTAPYPIDFVVLWVDGNDPEWQRRFNEYAPQDKQIDVDCGEARYRDWDCLRYWFRGVAQFAPWVRTVHFVTCGQVPEWLNTECDKLHLVRHEDFIPAEYLPTFSANPIEDNLHRIEGLSEHFVFFNDDFYLTAPVTPERFFVGGLPTDMAVLNTIQCEGLMGHITFNDLDAINRHFSKREVMRSLRHWFTPRYGRYMLRTMALMPWPRFSGFFDHHVPQAYRKHTLEEVWAAEPELMHTTCTHRFRHMADANQWIFRYWHLCKGEFAPLNVMRDATFYNLSDACFDQAIDSLQHSSKAIHVLNDSECITDIETKKALLQQAFQQLLPQKSIFER